MNKVISNLVSPAKYKQGDIFESSINDHYILTNINNLYICIRLKDGAAWTRTTGDIKTATHALIFVGRDLTITIER